MYLEKCLIEIKGETEVGRDKRQGKTKRRETEGGGGRVMTEIMKERETDRLGEIERDARQRGTPRTSMWRSIEQIYHIDMKMIYTLVIFL
jgi:hypothetical protein